MSNVECRNSKFDIRYSKTILAGVLTGMALMIRPTEFFWILPWVIFAGFENLKSKGFKNLLWLAVPLILVCLGGALMAQKTYGSPFAFGYQFHDPIFSNIEYRTSNIELRISKFEIPNWPFGFHPRNVWFNVRSYLLEYLAPWFILIVAAFWLAWKQKAARSSIYLAGWTIASLVLFYGQSLYQDHVRINEISIGNSFLRYMLPLAVVAAFSLGWLVHQRLSVAGTRRCKCGIVFLITFVSVFGLWTALARDAEGLFFNRQEILRYQMIRRETVKILPRATIIFSERSDKIFYPAYQVATPLPPGEQIVKLLTDGRAPVAFYLRNLDEQTAQRWQQSGIELRPLLNAGNETLYTARLIGIPAP
jgi:hypothetical protein